MVKLKGPLLSALASGKLGKAIQFDARRTGTVAGARRIPTQPRTEAQRATRLFLPFLAADWRDLTTAHRATWQSAPNADTQSPYHAYMKYNVDRWQHFPGHHWYPQTWHAFPTRTFPAAENTDPGTRFHIATAAGPGYLMHTISITSENDGSLFSYHRYSPEEPEPSPRNLVALFQPLGTGYHYHRITNLPPGFTKLFFIHSSHTGKPHPFYDVITGTVT